MSDLYAQVRHEISESSQVGAARRQAQLEATDAGLSPDVVGKVGIVVNELATNMLKHARGGELLVRRLPGGIEALAIDRGPGMKDVEQCLSDGYSTSGTPGTGLGSVRRQSDVFDLWSDHGGTVVVAQIGEGPLPSNGDGAVCVPLAGEQRCGDAWRIRRTGSRRAVIVVDGLGHGPDAADAAERACTVFDSKIVFDAKAILEECNQNMRDTRGGAVAVVCLDEAACSLDFCGIGNISGRIETVEKTRGLQSNNGIVGGAYRRAENVAYKWDADGLLILHSDGIQSRWSLEKYPGLRFRAAPVIAGVLFRDFTRDRDDATVVVMNLHACQSGH